MPEATQPWSAADVRASFINHFAGKQHANVPSSSVVPHDDPTLLFANAGMNQVRIATLVGLKFAFFFPMCLAVAGRSTGEVKLA